MLETAKFFANVRPFDVEVRILIFQGTDIFHLNLLDSIFIFILIYFIFFRKFHRHENFQFSCSERFQYLFQVFMSNLDAKQIEEAVDVACRDLDIKSISQLIVALPCLDELVIYLFILSVK